MKQQNISLYLQYVKASLMPHRSSINKICKSLNKIQKHAATRCFSQHHHKSCHSNMMKTIFEIRSLKIINNIFILGLLTFAKCQQLYRWVRMICRSIILKPWPLANKKNDE